MALLSDLINLDLSDSTEKIIAEYIWIGGSGMDLRSKARTLSGPVDDPSKLPKWNYDGSSTGQAPGEDSEVILYPQAIFKDPFRRGNHILVMCDTYTPAGEPIPTNKRCNADKIFSHPDVAAEVPWYGIEQEYTLLKKDVHWPLGWPTGGFPGPQGPYYCGIGADKAFGRDIVDAHYKACLYAGINISGINGEVMPGQWEFQVGPAVGISAGDELWVARYILERITEIAGVVVSFDPKPIPGVGETIFKSSSSYMAGSNEINLNDSKMVVPLNTWILISNFKLAYNLLRRPDGTFNRHLAEFLDRKVQANANPVDGVFSFDVIIDRGTSLLIRVYRPANADEGMPSIADLEKPLNSDVVPVIIFFHGGSFAHSSANSAIYDTLCRRLVGLCKAVVISVNYRRAPEYPYPCAYEDGWTALKWVSSRTWLQSQKDSKVHIYLAGDSSGGNIVHNVSLRAIESGTGIEVLGNILLNPMFGGKERTESEKRLDGKYFVTVQDRDWYWKAFLPEGEDRDHAACNPFGLKAISIEGMNFPKSLVVVAGLDLVQDWQLAYAEGLKKAGQEVKLLYLEQATIGFYLLPNNDHFYTVMNEIKSFVCSY